MMPSPERRKHEAAEAFTAELLDALDEPKPGPQSLQTPLYPHYPKIERRTRQFAAAISTLSNLQALYNEESIVWMRLPRAERTKYRFTRIKWLQHRMEEQRNQVGAAAKDVYNAVCEEVTGWEWI